MQITAISDTHGHHNKLIIPKCDVLIHAGDIGIENNPIKSLVAFNQWLGDLIIAGTCKQVVFVPGNHDWLFEGNPSLAKEILNNAHTLINDQWEYQDVKFWGSPYQPRFLNWAFNLNRGEELARVWAQIPEDTDILVTHSPPYLILDKVGENQWVGCKDLRRRVLEVQPQYHLFGHIHCGYGSTTYSDIHFINSSVCDEYNNCRTKQVPITFNIEK